MAQPTATKKTRKPKLSRKQLEDYNIFFYESVCKDEELDEWLISIRNQLIRLRRELPDDAKQVFAKQLNIFRASGQDSAEAFESGWSLMPPVTPAEPTYFSRTEYQKDGSEIRSIDNEIIECRKIANKALRWRDRNEQEGRWTTFLQNYFFRAYYDVYDNPNRHEEIFQRWEVHQDIYWGEFLHKNIVNARLERRTAPKPDLTYAFPIFDTTRNGNLSYIKHSEAENFTLPVLSKLRQEYDLKSAPTTRLQRWATDDVTLRANDLMCFPWAVVEAKRNKETEIPDIKYAKHNRKVRATDKSMEQFCYCQAANASAKALTLREELVEAAKERPKSHVALVIVSFTCVGSSVKLWITYRREPSKGSNVKKGPIAMVCVWATSLELIWGVLTLRMVIENLLDWVYRYPKHEISRWIGTVRKSSPQQTSLTPGGEKVVRERRAASCGRLRDRTNRASLGRQFTPSRAKPPPTLSRGETAPEYIGQRRSNDIIPTVKVNESVVRILDFRRGDEEYEETNEIKEDEGFASNGTDYAEADEDESSSNSNSPLEEHNIEYLSRPKSLDTQSSKESAEEGGCGETEDEEDVSDDDCSDGDRSDDKNYLDDNSEDDDSEGDDSEDGSEEFYYIDEQPHKPKTALRRSPRHNSSPADDYMSRSKAKRDQSPCTRL